MPAVIERRTGKVSDEAIAAGDRLLKAIKVKLLRKGGKIDYARLRKQGYSEGTIARLKEL
jgi:hypothetical protein